MEEAAPVSGGPKKPRLVFTDLQRRTLQAIFKVCVQTWEIFGGRSFLHFFRRSNMAFGGERDKIIVNFYCSEIFTIQKEK
jgi:hypothetical protein